MKDTFQRVWGLLTAPERRAFLYAMVIMFIGMILEMLGVGLILPAMGLLTGNGQFSDSPAIERLRDSVSQNMFGVVVAGGLVALFFIKNAFLSYQAWVQQRFIFGVQESLSYRLLSKYLHLPYTFHLGRNSAQLIRNTVNEISTYTLNVVSPIMTILTELIVITGLLFLMLWLEPTGTIAVGGLLVIVGLIYFRLTHRKSTKLGEERMLNEGLRIQHIQQCLGGAKELKLLGSEQVFLDSYQTHNQAAARAARFHTFLVLLPRLLLEVVGITAFGILIAVIAVQGRSFEAAIPVLAVLAAAAFRLIPSANRIVTSITLLKYGRPVIQVLSDEMNIQDDEEGIIDSESGKAKLSLTEAIEIKGVSFSYELAKEITLSDVTIRIDKNTSVGIIGKSGSGKSTLVDIILGLLTPASGGVFVDGKDVRENIRHWQNQIGYVPQTIFLSDDTLRRNVAFGIPNDRIDDARVMEVLKAAHLSDLIDHLPDGLDAFVGERGVRLSGGQRQRIGIARALYRDPEVLVFDEATSSLDNESEEKVMEAVKSLHGSRTVIIVAHRLSTIEHCDRLIRLEKGRIVGGETEGSHLVATTS